MIESRNWNITALCGEKLETRVSIGDYFCQKKTDSVVTD